MTRRLLRAAAAAAVVAAVVVAAPLLDRDELALRVGSDVFVNASKPIDANNTPTLVQNPVEPGNLVLVHRVDRPAFSALLHASHDGGATWDTATLPLPENLDRPFAPDAAFGLDGTLYVSYVNLVGNGNVPANLWVARSDDGGRTLGQPVRVTGELAFQARLVVDFDGTVHVTWLQAAGVGFLRIVGGPNPILAARSTDGGRTFSEPVTVSDAGRERVGAATPVVDAEGRLLVLYEDFKSDRRDFEFLEGPPWDEPFALVLTRSEDGGRTFRPGREVDARVEPAKRFLVFLPEFPSIAAALDGSIYVAWADARNGDEDVFLRRSSDGGETWTAPVRVNDNAVGDGTSQYLPQVDVAPGGRVDVLYLDRRSDPEHDALTRASFATSDDGGRTFERVALSSQPFDARVGPVLDDAIGVDVGSRLGLVSLRHGAVAAWTDARLGTEDTGRQDIAAAPVAISRPPIDRSRLNTLLAILVAAAGLLLASMLVDGRRRSRVPPGARDGREVVSETAAP